MDQPARTAVLVLNWNGRKFLSDCFHSLARLDVFTRSSPTLPGHTGATEVWLVDNGSTDGSVVHVQRAFPWVKILSLPENMGFSRAYNRAVEVCQAEWVVFLNNDTKVRPDWLSQLHACAARHPKAAAVASCVLSGDGSRIDFVGGDTFFFGQAYQTHAGQPVQDVPLEEKQLLFGCAAAFMVRRSAFLKVGGFDPDYFSFFEDVDLGWRLNLVGEEVWFCPQAVVLHQGHGTWGVHDKPAKRFLLERNGLANVFKNWGDERMGVFLLYSEILAFLRGFTAYSTPRPTYPPRLRADFLAHFSALGAVSQLLEGLKERRRTLGHLRVRQDQELLPLLGAFCAPPLGTNPTITRLFRWILWRLELLEGKSLPAWDEATNSQALEVALQLSGLCQQALAHWKLSWNWREQTAPLMEGPVPLSLAQMVYRLRFLLERFLLRPLDRGALAWLAERLAHLQLEVEENIRVTVCREIPPVSVVVRTKNRPSFLSQALASVAAQTRKPDEVLVVNDGGEDPSPVVLRFSKSLPVRLLNVPQHQGRTWAAQTGLLAAKGVAVGFLDDDDQWLPSHLEVLGGALALGARVAYSNVEVVKTDASGQVIARGFLAEEFNPIRLFFENFIPIIAVLLEKELAMKVGGFDTTLQYFEDWDLWVRLSQEELFLHCPVVTARYFVRPAFGHGQATSGEHRWPHFASVFAKHQHLVSGWAWADYFQQEVESARKQRDELGQKLERVFQSRSWRFVQVVRRLLRRR